MITLLILYYINIVRKGKEKISFPHLLVGSIMYLQGTDLRKEALCLVIFLYNEKENNDMKVIGFRKSSFKGDDGQEVSGVNLFLTEKCEKGEGLSCDRIYVMDRILAASGYTPKLGDEVIIEWNRWGKCSGIRLAKF